jgi:putative peptide zinc metalloprotease protein
MLCQACHIRTRRDFPYCLRCGTARRGAKVAQFDAPELRWGDPRTTAALTKPVTTIGREPDNDVVLDDGSVSRHHARIVREANGFRYEDLGSFNGSAVTHLGRPEMELRADSAVLSDEAVVHVGDVPLTFTQPRATHIGARTQLRGTEHTMLGTREVPDGEATTATEPLNATPRRRSGWALKRMPDQQGEQVWILRNTRTNAYLSLDEKDVFVWDRLDGETSIRDLLFAYLDHYGELALPRIEGSVRTFADAGLVRGLPDTAPELTPWRRFTQAVIKNLIRVEVSIRGLDPLLDRAYRAFAWRMFTPLAVVVVWALTLAGLWGFWKAGEHRALFDVGGAGWIGGAVVVAGYVLATTLHELAHAFAVKSYGRRVNRGGFLLMMGMPFAFVDTSDMWFGSSWSRIVVAVSGPLATTGIAGAAGLVAAFSPDPRVGGVAYTLAFGLYFNTLYNLIPLVPLDGYQALADALRTPRLKEEAKDYFTHELWSDVKARRRPGAKQLGLAVFGALSMVCLWAMLGLSALTWNSRVGAFAREEIPQPFLTVLIAIVLALVFFPVWYPRARSLALRWRRRREARATGPDVADQAASRGNSASAEDRSTPASTGSAAATASSSTWSNVVPQDSGANGKSLP